MEARFNERDRLKARVRSSSVRDSDGLALSSRNLYLTEEERTRALSLSRSLKRASKMVMQGIYDVEAIRSEMEQVMADVEIEYIAFVNRSFESIISIEIGNTIVLVAAKAGKTRLIDNLWM